LVEAAYRVPPNWENGPVPAAPGMAAPTTTVGSGELCRRVIRQKARRARRVAPFPAAALRRRGLGLVPSGREPHWDVSFGPVYGDMFGAEDAAEVGASELEDRLLGAPYTVQENGYYEQDLT
jgi:hypothetical protein